ncbi:MAG: gliding motility-associated-like protein, partial [Flavobacteriales bacterium]
NLQVIGELTIYVPNAFSPNGDGLNDVFTPVINGLTENSYRLKVFNRWGEEIFKSDDITLGWDGTFKNEKCPPESYSWQLFVKSEYGVSSKTITGIVTLLR